jgi:glycosyltransferase involved in cell wall biosynthesis
LKTAKEGAGMEQKKLFVMTKGNYGYAYDLYKHVLEKEGFKLYQLELHARHNFLFNTYLFHLLFRKYDLIFSWEVSRALLAVFAKYLPVWSNRTRDTKLITMYSRICGEAMEAPDHGMLWGQKGCWLEYAPLFESDAIAWNYDCYKELLSYFPRFAREDFFVIHGGVDTSVYSPDDKIREPKTVVAISNWFRPRKKVDILIKAMKYLPDWKLYVCGNFLQDEYKKECYHLAESLPNVKLLGFVDNKAEWLKKASVFVIPSEFETGVESINEAMACGCKVLRVEGGGAEEFLDKKQILPKGFDASILSTKILEVYEDDNLISRNLEIVKRYSWDAIQKEVEIMLEAV